MSQFTTSNLYQYLENASTGEIEEWYSSLGPIKAHNQPQEQAIADDTNRNTLQIVNKARELSILREKVADEKKTPWLKYELDRAKKELKDALADYRATVTKQSFTDLAIV